MCNFGTGTLIDIYVGSLTALRDVWRKQNILGLLWPASY